MTAETFRSTVVPAGNATGAEVPAEVVGVLGEGKRPKVAITINGHTWRSRVASKGGRYLVGISAANRAVAGIDEGDEIEVTLELDTEPREVDEPADLMVALDAAPTARAAFDRLPFGLRRKHVNDIEAAKPRRHASDESSAWSSRSGEDVSGEAESSEFGSITRRSVAPWLTGPCSSDPTASRRKDLERMNDAHPFIDYANLPAPSEGIVVTTFITVRSIARSRAFYRDVLEGTVVLEENPCMVKLANSWIIMNPGGPPTPDKPDISVVNYEQSDTTSIFMNLRVADIDDCYRKWSERGAQFLTPPIDRGAEIRCYMRDPDGYLIEVGQSTGLLSGHLAARRPEDLPG